jgi:hypothetical protein
VSSNRRRFGAGRLATSNICRQVYHRLLASWG